MNEKSDNLQCDQIFFRKNSSSLSSKMYPSERPHCLGLEETKAKTRPVANSSSKQLRPWPPFQTVSLKVFGQFSIFSSKQLRSSFSQKFIQTHDFFFVKLQHSFLCSRHLTKFLSYLTWKQLKIPPFQKTKLRLMAPQCVEVYLGLYFLFYLENLNQMRPLQGLIVLLSKLPIGL